ncbi:MAG: TonB-dependent receptor [Saprospiraceae bacterium]|jgi:TonB-linked SusC/RagA family outer membrane protein|nr:TonB-dependent receptor [Saprospiraceae bacterium]
MKRHFTEFLLKKVNNWFLTCFLSLLVIGLNAQVNVSGSVSDENGIGLPGATILEKGNDTNGTITDIDGNYSIKVSSGATLVISFTGYQTVELPIGQGGKFDVKMEVDQAILEEVVVTGYQVLRKRNISGAVSVISTKEMAGIQSSSFTQQLSGRATGVTVSSSGAPGDATNVRIRGISSFQSNDPLYIIDGVPTTDRFQTSINPADIESMQVLKDASSASIYGSRASNGVIVITTKKGKAGKVKMSYDGSLSVANPVKGFDKVLNTDSKTFVDAMKLRFANDAQSLPPYARGEVPKYITPSQNGGYSNTINEADYDPINNPITLINQQGTNWWEEMSRSAMITNHNLTISGGGENATFLISGGYFNQEGVLNHTYFNRGSLRANSSYKITSKIRAGQNLVFVRSGGVGVGTTGGQNNEQGVLGSLLKANPLVSVRDIKGNPGSNISLGLSNNNNPVAQLEQNKDNTNVNNRLFGNVYAEVDILKGLTARTNFGTDIGFGQSRRFTFPNPYRNEGDKTANSFREDWNTNVGWTWTNTLAYNTSIGNKHDIGILVGQEAIKNNFRNVFGSLANYFTTDVNAWYINTAFGVPASRAVGSGGGESRLASVFGKVDYSYDDTYFLSATMRRDGSSKFLSDVRYGVFPAVSAAVRVSKFLPEVAWLSDLKLRGSYGELGNQNIDNYRFVDNFGGSVGGTFYDISGTNTSPVTGYALTAYGNSLIKWETSKTTNVGLDIGLLDNALTVVLDVYQRNTSDLLYNPPLPLTAGVASSPFKNVGGMKNTGLDLGITYSKNITKDLGLNITLNASHYKNEITNIADDVEEFYSNDNLTERLPQGNATFVNKIGYPLSAFRGYEVVGLIQNEADLVGQPASSAIGGLKFRDTDGDGVITDDDATIIGSPHPSLTLGLNLGVNYKNFDVQAFVLGVYGNEIYNATKIQSYFQNFNSNVGIDVVSVQGTGSNPKLNALDAGSRNSSTFFIEDGSYTRLGNLVIGYKFPASTLSKLGIGSFRAYLQGQNLLTLTNYSGVDPAVSNANIGNAGNVNDLRTGYDNGNYPSNKIITFGINLGF